MQKLPTAFVVVDLNEYVCELSVTSIREDSADRNVLTSTSGNVPSARTVIGVNVAVDNANAQLRQNTRNLLALFIFTSLIEYFPAQEFFGKDIISHADNWCKYVIHPFLKHFSLRFNILNQNFPLFSPSTHFCLNLIAVHPHRIYQRSSPCDIAGEQRDHLVIALHLYFSIH